MKQRLTALAFVLALIVSFLPATAATPPAVDLGALPLLGVEIPQWMTPVDGIVQAAPSWCTNQSNQYCTYAWNKFTACCYATWVAQGAYCPTMCY